MVNEAAEAEKNKANQAFKGTLFFEDLFVDLRAASQLNFYET